jgi:predicted enzyme related to lactoylglutathione lyase
MYPHLNVPDIIAATDRFGIAGFKIVQPPITYDWSKEAFVQDPDGYVIGLVTMAKAN